MTYFFQNNIEAPSPARLRAFPAYATEVMKETVGDLVEDGRDHMRGIVPHGATNALASAVSASGPSVIENRIFGSVFVDPFAAPHADLVDRGTGVDGPFRQGVLLTRPSKTKPGKPGVMNFSKRGEPGKGKEGNQKFRREVKSTTSQKIRRGMGFRDSTYDYMKIKTGEAVEVITASSLPNYFRATGAR